MTYKEILNSVAEKTIATYSAYIHSKIAAVSGTTDLSDQTEQHRAEYERLEKKLIALIAIIKKDGSLDIEAPDNYEEDFTE